MLRGHLRLRHRSKVLRHSGAGSASLEWLVHETPPYPLSRAERPRGLRPRSSGKPRGRSEWRAGRPNVLYLKYNRRRDRASVPTE
jgi:hypothetical protein